MSLFQVIVLAYVFTAGAVYQSLVEGGKDRDGLAQMSVNAVKGFASMFWPIVMLITAIDATGGCL